jgi:signal transduction histidine kinase
LLVGTDAHLHDRLKQASGQRWQVETAANGAIALTMIQQQPPDLVLSEATKAAGLQLLNHLRADATTRSIPVILLLAQADEAAIGAGLAAGADDYLVKPFFDCELTARIKTQLQLSRLRQELALSRFKDEFLKPLTQELQSPLTLILGWVRLLQTRSFDAAHIAQGLSAIDRNATLEAKLIRNLLDASAILAGKLRLKPQMVDLVALTQNTVATFQPAAEAKRVRLVETIAIEVQRNTMVDGDRFKQMLANLLDNAIKFTPAGGQTQIRLERLGSGVKMTVSDTGIGIPPERLPHLFDRFSRIEASRSFPPGGIGLGLAIVRHLVELHQGTIEVFSEGEGCGATFTVRLPTLDVTELNANPPS